MRSKQNRVELHNGTVHYANEAGRPACGSAQRTHGTWMTPTFHTVTCRNCEKQFGLDRETLTARMESAVRA